jgi:hypothetical protein
MTQAVHSSLSSPRTVSTTTTFPITPPVQPDLSRPRLKQIARWIRDELDLRIARDGPDILRPNDVLTLHETLVALRHAPNITVSVLRATGIHKAVQDIAGVATRWPGRLCDDCDKITDIWTAKFGPFSEIHPFLYGRGGRLEGIASVSEYSREVSSRYFPITFDARLIVVGGRLCSSDGLKRVLRRSILSIHTSWVIWALLLDSKSTFI